LKKKSYLEQRPLMAYSFAIHAQDLKRRLAKRRARSLQAPGRTGHTGSAHRDSRGEIA